MKKFIILLLVPLFAQSQKNVISVDRLLPKPDKIAEFETAVSAHIQKYHTGNWKMHVFEIQTGEYAGSYDLVEGPNTWNDIDDRKDLSAEHTNDWLKNIAPLTSGRQTSVFGELKSELSSNIHADSATKLSINHLVAKPGKISKVMDIIKTMKNMWDKDGQSVEVYQMMLSGEPGFAVVTNMKNGLKDLTGLKPLGERYEAANGAGSFEKFQQDFNDAVQNRWEELVIYRPDLSSK